MGSSWRDTVRRRQGAVMEASTEEARAAAEQSAVDELDRELDEGAGRSRVV